jgi:signal transduction histidine kinase
MAKLGLEKNSEMTKKSGLKIVFAGIFIWLFLTHIIFLMILSGHRTATEESLIASIRQTEGNDSLEVSRAVAEFARARLVRCLKLKKGSDQTLIFDQSFQEECSPAPWWRSVEEGQVSAASTNGQLWSVQFTAIPPYGFLWALWVVRGLGSLVIALVVYAFYFRSRTAALALKYERENAENLERIARQVGHDVRSPIGALKIVLAKYLKAESPEFELSTNALGRIEQIAEDLLVKGPQGFSGDWHSMNIRELIKEVISEKQQNSQNKQFELNCSLDQISTQARRADLSRIISNLIQNSLEASDGQRENLITIDVSKRGLWIEIGIKDTGKGISDSVLQKLRIDPASHDKPGGHGLGLKHSQTIVKNLGGSFEIHSKEGVSTEIILRLPTR